MQLVTRDKYVGEWQVVEIRNVHAIRRKSSADVPTCERKMEKEIASDNVGGVRRKNGERFLSVDIPSLHNLMFEVARYPEYRQSEGDSLPGLLGSFDNAARQGVCMIEALARGCVNA